MDVLDGYIITVSAKFVKWVGRRIVSVHSVHLWNIKVGCSS